MVRLRELTMGTRSLACGVFIVLLSTSAQTNGQAPPTDGPGAPAPSTSTSTSTSTAQSTSDPGSQVSNSKSDTSEPVGVTGPITPTKVPQGIALQRHFFRNLVEDQKTLWSSPFHIQKDELKWLVPLGAATVALIATDTRTSRYIAGTHSLTPISINVSRLATSTGYAAVAIYLVGIKRGSRREKETGILLGEALLDTILVSEPLKMITQRPSPWKDNADGKFFSGGDSFPSGHAMAAWAFATVVAEEYSDHPLIKIGAYGLATAVSVARYTGDRHFLSEVLVGTAMGYGIGRFVYHTHHNFNLDGPIDNVNTTSRDMFPLIAPEYIPAQRLYGLKLTWRL